MDKPTSDSLPVWMRNLIDTVRSRNFDADELPAPDFPSPISELQAFEESSRPIPIEEVREHRPHVSDKSTFSNKIFFDIIPELEKDDDFNAQLRLHMAIKWRRKTKRELCETALMLENTYYKIQSGKRMPGRDTIICLALALGLTIKETQRFLGCLGYGLSRRIRRDYVIMRCLAMGKKPLEVNLVLDELMLRPLGPNNL